MTSLLGKRCTEETIGDAKETVSTGNSRVGNFPSAVFIPIKGMA
jgi:hypothetical protein